MRPSSTERRRSLRLRHVQGLAAHQTAVDDEHGDDGMDLERGAGEPQAERDVVEDPALADPVGHEGVDAEGGGDGGALEVAGLAAGVLGDVGGRHVEARQPRQPAQHEDGQQRVVQRRAQAQAEGYAGGGQAEGDLFCMS